MVCDPSTTISSTDLSDLKKDITTIDDVVESTLNTTITKDGKTINTLLGQLKLLGFQPPITYTSGIVFTVNDGTKTVDEAGVVYAPLPSALPFTTSGTFIGDDNSRFFTIQGSNDSPTANDVKNLTSVPQTGFLYVGGFMATGDGGDHWWKLKGFDSLKAGNSFDLNLMELYDSFGNIYEPYGVLGDQKLQIKPEAVGAVGDFLSGVGTDNILVLEALRDYLQSKKGGVVLLGRFSVYGVSRSFKMGTSRFSLVDYIGTGTSGSAAGPVSGFGKLASFVSSPAPTATKDSVLRMNANDFTDSVGTFEGWQCRDFFIQGIDGVDDVACISVVGAVRGSTLDNIRTSFGHDGIALTSCFGHIFTRCLSTNATRTGHNMGDGAYGVINDVVVNVATFTGNTATNCGDWGLHYRFGNAIGMNANTYELNDKNVWIQDVKSGNISNLYVEGATGGAGLLLKVGGNNSEGGIVANVSIDGVIAAFGVGNQVLIRGASVCEFTNFRLDPAAVITSDNAGENRVNGNSFRNAVHDSTISKTKNITDTNFEDDPANITTHQNFSGGNTGFQGSFFLNTLATTPVSMSTALKSGMLLVTGEDAANNTLRWTDVVYFCTGGTIVSEAKTTRGAPPTRTYTTVGGVPTIETNVAAKVSIIAFGYN